VFIQATSSELNVGKIEASRRVKIPSLFTIFEKALGINKTYLNEKAQEAASS